MTVQNNVNAGIRIGSMISVIFAHAFTNSYIRFANSVYYKTLDIIVSKSI